MSRPAGELTKDIRKLLEESKGDITYGQARPRLKNMGWTLARKPKPKSPEFSILEQKAMAVGKKLFTVLETDQLLDRALSKCNFNSQITNTVRREFMVRRNYHDEANNFNVVKCNWGELQTSRRTQSKKPKPIQTQAKKETVKSIPNAGSLTYVKQRGGIAKIQRQITAMQKKAADLRNRADKLITEAELAQAAIDEVQELKKMVQDAA